ncbi:hypothetical protein JOD97_001975 [Duganella sp. 1411]|uniref:hypothetical protein n=1 Tax=Duganella sp. 1411 TaxID=2806572 RepID=UPI001AE2EC6D|nr:hypothetical protein [Duganella sp. 1411]MBP1203961.1 hypothetical protein [Duganella sp. 1411]
MAQQSLYFFKATKNVSDELGNMFSFSWASYLGLRELWWQSRGYASVHPELTAKQIEKKFTGGLPLPGGIDFEELFLKMSWAEHERRVAKSILFEACSMYEQWLEAVCSEMRLPSSRAKVIADQLQFPLGHTTGNGIPNDYQVALDYLKLHNSMVIGTEFLPNLRKNKLNCLHHLSSYITAYRYFKECRNSLIHSSGKVNARIIKYHLNLVLEQTFVNTPLALPFNHEFSLTIAPEDDTIPLSIQDCKLFATVVQRIIVMLDAELAVYQGCEDIVKSRVGSIVKTDKSKWINLIGSNAKKQATRTNGLLAKSGLPKAVDALKVYNWLRAEKVVP